MTRYVRMGKVSSDCLYLVRSDLGSTAHISRMSVMLCMYVCKFSVVVCKSVWLFIDTQARGLRLRVSLFLCIYVV